MELKVWKISPWTNLALREDFLFQSRMKLGFPGPSFSKPHHHLNIHLMGFLLFSQRNLDGLKYSRSGDLQQCISRSALKSTASLTTLVLQLAIIDGRRLIEESTTQLGILLNKPCGAESSQALQFSSDNRVSFSF